MDIKLDNDAMNAIVAKSILDSLTPERREALISQAIVKLLTANQSTDPYNRDKRSDLQRAFDTAVYDAAHKYAHNHLAENAEFKAQLEALFAEAAAKLFAKESRGDLVNGIASYIRNALTKDRY